VRDGWPPPGGILADAVTSLVDSQRRLRHADIGTTVGTYLQPTSAADERAAATLEHLVLEEPLIHCMDTHSPKTDHGGDRLRPMRAHK
jgi:hypothetical protein